MGALHINGQKATGVNIILANGVFIDTDNVIVAKTSYTPSTFSYTATEDCVLYIEIPALSGYSTFLEIDGKEVQGVNIGGGTTNYLISTVLLKKGQTATLSSSNFPSVTPDYAVYGIQQGTIEGAYAHHYSTDEKVAGTWIDGSTLYEKTIEYNCQDTSNTQVAYTGDTGDKIVQLVDYYFINSQNVQIRLMWAGQAFWDFISGLSTLTVKRNTNDANWQSNVKFVATVQYIKTT